MCGPSGVGKTETAMALAEQLAWRVVTTLPWLTWPSSKNMNLYVPLSSPPVIGFGEGGVLTGSYSGRNPYSASIGGMEKAHPGVHDLFYQIFDKGHIKDSEGRTVDFKNTIIIMTSNAADQAICDVCAKTTDRTSTTMSYLKQFVGSAAIL